MSQQSQLEHRPLLTFSKSSSIATDCPSSRKTGYMLSRNASRAIFKDCSSRSCLPRPCRKLVVCGLNSQWQASHLSTRNSSSSTRWKSRQGRDSFAREAKVQGLKSRAAFKLLEVCWLQSMAWGAANMKQIDAKYKLFKKGQTVVDLVWLIHDSSFD